MFFIFCLFFLFLFFFFNDTATTEIYTLSLHDALPILVDVGIPPGFDLLSEDLEDFRAESADRKSTRLNSSHGYISYAVFCLKKKKKKEIEYKVNIICNERVRMKMLTRSRD